MISFSSNVKLLTFFLLIIFFLSCKIELIEPVGLTVNIEADTVRFAAIGDFGDGSESEGKVAKLVDSYNPDFIISLGDNNYPHGKEKTIIENIGQFYYDYIYNFDAPSDQICKGRAYEEKFNRFFATSGNHDYDNPDFNIPYLNYFTLPGNEVNYDIIWGPVHIYSIDSNADVYDQHIWFDKKLAASEQPFNIIFFHHPPYSEGIHGNEIKMQWDFTGIDLVLAGHDHSYQRITKVNEEFPVYLVNGLGGQPIKDCGVYPLDPTKFNSTCYNENFGSLFIEANDSIMKVQFIALGNKVIDSFTVKKTNQ